MIKNCIRELEMFVVYMTIYDGDKLPPYYIGSTSKLKYDEGYTGSVTSKKYRKTYELEKSENPHLFETVILAECIDRKTALVEELFWQKRVNAKFSDMYFNMSWAQRDGFCGRDTSGENHPLFGTHNCKNYMHSYNPVTKEENFLPYVPEGNVKGRLSVSPNYKGKKWWTDGTNDVFAAICPIGYNRGRSNVFSVKPGTKKVYTNGVINRYFEIGTQPDGWRNGMVRKK